MSKGVNVQRCKNIFKLYPNLKIVSSYNLFLDDIIE